MEQAVTTHDTHSDYETPSAGKPRTLFVLLMLVAAAGTFSYLWAYAVTDALIAAEVMRQWADGTDPRPRRLVATFATLMALFLVVGMVGRVVSRRQFRRIDAMASED